MGDVLLETRIAYLSLKGTSHSLVRTRHRAHGVLRVPPPAAAGRRPLTVTEQCYYSATLSWIKLNSAPESPLSGLCHTVAAHDEQLL